MKPLYEAVRYGTPAEIDAAIQRGEDINAYDRYGCTPLVGATMAQKPENVRCLLKYRPWVDEKDFRGCTPLFWGVDYGNPDIVEQLLKAGANPNQYNASSQPVITYPLLRRQQRLLKLLVDHGADIHFGRDYIHSKLLAHRYELAEQGYILSPEPMFIPLSYEGFFLEFTLGAVRESITQFMKSRDAQKHESSFPLLRSITGALDQAIFLRQIREQGRDVRDHEQDVNEILKGDPLLVPISYEGHAITFVRYGRYLAQCDRGARSKTIGSVVIYEITRPEAFSVPLLHKILFERNTGQFINMELTLALGLEFIEEIPTESQVTGNCSWANVEASIATMLCMHHMEGVPKGRKRLRAREDALKVYMAWKEWDKDRALGAIIREFRDADIKRQAAMSTLLGAVLYQRLDASNRKDVERAAKILTLIQQPKFLFVLKSYVNAYCRASPLPPRANNFLKLLKKNRIKVDALLT